MKAFVVVIGWGTDHRKSPDFETELEAEAHAAEYGGFVAPNPGGNHKYWIVDPVAETVTVDTVQEQADNLAASLATCKSAIATAMQDRLVQGIRWKLNSGASWNQISLDSAMQNFFVVANAERSRGRANPHNGKIWQGDIEFDIDDVGIEDLAKFAGAWGFKICQIARAERSSLAAMTTEQRGAYDGGAINWTIRDATIGTMTVTNWTASDIANKWVDDTCQQN